MIDRYIAVFSGIHPKVVNKLTPKLRSIHIEPVTVSFSEGFTREYFERLVKEALAAAAKQTARSDVRLSSVLISALTESDLQFEKEAFFPAFRRVPIRREWRNNPSAADKIAEVVYEHFRAEESKNFTQSLAAREEWRLLLPPKNTPSKALLTEFEKIYNCTTQVLSHKAIKEIVSQRRTRSFKVRDLRFALTVNSENHPVRRCTDSCLCDLKAGFRFGVAVPARLEFDLTADRGLESKSFYNCDGSIHRVSAAATHLNMRINDDFQES